MRTKVHVPVIRLLVVFLSILLPALPADADDKDKQFVFRCQLTQHQFSVRYTVPNDLYALELDRVDVDQHEISMYLTLRIEGGITRLGTPEVQVLTQKYANTDLIIDTANLHVREDKKGEMGSYKLIKTLHRDAPLPPLWEGMPLAVDATRKKISVSMDVPEDTWTLSIDNVTMLNNVPRMSLTLDMPVTAGTPEQVTRTVSWSPDDEVSLAGAVVMLRTRQGDTESPHRLVYDMPLGQADSGTWDGPPMKLSVRSRGINANFQVEGPGWWARQDKDEVVDTAGVMYVTIGRDMDEPDPEDKGGLFKFSFANPTARIDHARVYARTIIDGRISPYRLAACAPLGTVDMEANSGITSTSQLELSPTSTWSAIINCKVPGESIKATLADIQHVQGVANVFLTLRGSDEDWNSDRINNLSVTVPLGIARPSLVQVYVSTNRESGRVYRPSSPDQ